MSMVWPGLANGGSSAWIATAATFFSCGLTPGGTLTPSSPSMFFRLCTVNGALAGAVAGVVQADHKAVADQRVAAHATDPGSRSLIRSACAAGRNPASSAITQSSAGIFPLNPRRLNPRTWMCGLLRGTRISTCGLSERIRMFDPQYGYSRELKKRPSQPIALDWASAPRPP